MIKFFRHIRRSLINQNKMGKYFKYAIGEILLVVIGILIALQINTWNTKRLDSLKEKAILKELHKEFLGNKIQFDSVKLVHTRSMKSLNTIIDAMPLTKENVFNLMDDFNYALHTFTFNPSSGVVNSLIASGNYELIKNDTLRNYLVTWKDVYQDFLEEELNHQKYRYEVMDPHSALNTDAIMLNKGDQEAIDYTLDYVVSREFRGHLTVIEGRLQNIITELEEKVVENHINEIIRLTQTND
jgi:hypothetical protein